MDLCNVEDSTGWGGTCWQKKLLLILQIHEEQARFNTRQVTSKQRNVHMVPEPPYPETAPPLKYVSFPFVQTRAWSFGAPFEEGYYKFHQI
jgi:hypothetical protein